MPVACLPELEPKILTDFAGRRGYAGYDLEQGTLPRRWGQQPRFVPPRF